MQRREYHPPRIEDYEAPTADNPGYFGPGPQGFGSKKFYVAQIPAKCAREIIINNHYSKRVVNNSYLHLGVFIEGKQVGVLQFGYALNPRKVGHIVKDTAIGEYLELNRMWLSDEAPRNSESQAIAYAIRYIKKVMPMVAWIQSFADERCGGWGVVYQASNFLYCGFHYTKFYELDGNTYHEMLLTAHAKGGGRGRYLRKNLHRAVKHKLRQFRYIFFVKNYWRSRLRFPVLPYPKNTGNNGQA